MERTYGKLKLSPKKTKWYLEDITPHVAIKLKALFEFIPKTQIAPFYFENTTEVSADLFWFIQRYKMEISESDLNVLKRKKKKFYDDNNALEEILAPDYVVKEMKMKDGFVARDYQSRFAELTLKVKRILCGDELGIGKTVTAIVTMKPKVTLPAIVVVQSHMVNHWREKVEMFTNLSVHFIKQRKPYSIPSADVYIIKYGSLQGWVDVFATIKYKFVIYDEVQEVRRHESLKHQASKVLSSYATHVLGLSATPIYNYGDEIFNIMQVIKPNSLGKWNDFNREWCGYKGKVHDPTALGTYLRESFLFLKRTRKEVGRELPVINTIVHTVDYDESEVEKSEDLAKTLALKVMEGSFVERGQAARELDILARYITGISKAKYVAEFVKFIVQSGEPVVLAGWHRDCYKIWHEELKEFKISMYTGSESPAQKEQSKQEFIDGETDIFILSLRSGIGIDGLQHRCKTVIFGELDWSPQVHNQLIGRVDRDGQENQVTVYYLISNYGSDLPIIDMLGVKSAQSHNIINPLGETPQKFSDESRMKVLAKQYLEQQKE